MRIARTRRRKLFCAMDAASFSIIMVIVVFSTYLVVFVEAAQKSLAAAHSGVYLPSVGRTRPLWEYKDDEMTVTIVRDGKLFFGYQLVTPPEIPLRIRTRLSCGAASKVYLRVDARTQYKNVTKVLAYIRYSGIERVTFLARQREPQD